MIPSRIWWLSAAAAAAISLAVLSLALTQAPLPSAPPAAASNDPFGEEVTLVEKTIVYISGSGVWDSAFENDGTPAGTGDRGPVARTGRR